MQSKKNSIQAIALDFIDKKDNKTFSVLINRLKPGLHSFVRKFLNDSDLCNEVVSQTFVTVWEKLDQYNSKYNFSTWVYAIAKNEALGIIRKQKRNLSHETLTENHSRILKIYSPQVTMDMEVVAPSGEELTKFLYDKTMEEIENLKEPYKTVMRQREVEQKQLQDIAKHLSWNLSTVKTRLRKARKDIQEILKKKHPELIESYYEKDQVIF